MSMRFTRLRIILLAVLASASLPGYLNAQSASASITGIVTDPSGSAVPEATVEARNAGTGAIRAFSTSADGAYLIQSLLPGSYEISISKAGFRTYTQSGIILNVGQSARIDVALAIGATTEKIEVVANAQLTETQNAVLGQVVEQKRIVDLPLNGRNPVELIRLSAGVRLLDSTFLDTSGWNLTSASINGGQGGTNAVLVDGGAATLMSRNEYVAMPNVDAVEEFKVNTNSFSAEFGLTGGGVISVVTKSGTNEWHGGVFEFLRNDKLDANGWTNNSRRVAKPALRYNQFGGSIGGPVIFPGYNGKNKTFFFFNYEGVRFRSNLTNLLQVPTEIERAGDFTNSFIRDPRNGSIVPVSLFDPATTRPNPAGSGFVRSPLPGNRIPSSRLDPVAVKSVAYYPSPNRTPDDRTGINNFVSIPSRFIDTDQYNLRVDHNFGSRNRLFGRYSYVYTANPSFLPLFGFDNLAEPSGTLSTRPGRNFVLSDLHTFSPRVLNELTISVNRQLVNVTVPASGKNAPSLIGLPATVPGYVFPRLEVGNVTTIGSRAAGLALVGRTGWQIADSVSWNTGRHSLKAGIDFRRAYNNTFQPNGPSGVFNFGSGLTGDPLNPQATGYGPATLMLGSVASGFLTVEPGFAFGFPYFGTFVQDDWKVNRRLTINLGMRYETVGPVNERFNQIADLNPDRINPVTNFPGVVEFGAVDYGRTNYPRDYNNFGPRFGLAYDIAGNGRTVLRAGFGVYYSYAGDEERPTSYGFSARTDYANAAGPFQVFQLKDGPPRIDLPLGSALGPRTLLGQNATIQQDSSRTPYSQQWNFGIQHQLRSGLLVEATYAGNHGVKLIATNVELNALPPEYQSLGFALDDRVPNPAFGVLPPGTPISSPTIPRSRSYFPFQTFNSVAVRNPQHGNSIYHALQIRVEKRFSQGLSFLMNFTGSKQIGDVGRNLISFTTVPQGNVGCGQLAAFDRRACRAIDPQDVSRNLIISGVYELPFGPGKPFLAGKSFASALARGWQVNGIFAARSGLPLVVRGANNRAADRPNILRSAKLGSDEQTLLRWFDTSAFAAPPLFTYGSTPNTLPDVRGPGFMSLDFSVLRNITITERVQLQIRAESFNVTNRVNFSQPNVNFLSSGFGQVTAAGEGRRLQFGAKINF